jgi:hypothetical protein
MATKKLQSLKGRRMRVTRLDACGEVVIGACSSIVTSGFITVEWSFEYQEGTEYQQQDAWGDYCIDEQDPGRLRWVNVSINACDVDPDLLDMAANATPVTAGADTIGVTWGPGVNDLGFAVEVWTKQAGRNCSGGNPEWGYWVAPFIINGRMDGAMSISNGPLNLTMVGQAVGAPASWGETPYDDNPLLRTGGFPAGEFLGVVRTTVQPPALTNGCAAIAA